jgi:hypothetical protein
MYKLLFSFLVSGVLFSQSINHKGKKFGLYSGPSIGIRNHIPANQISLGAKFGGDFISGALDLNIGNINTIKPKFVIDFNYYYKNNELVMGPTFDIGPSINFNIDNFMLNFIEIGIGYRISYLVSKTMGIVFIPVHLTSSFFTWMSGGAGFEADYYMHYQSRFGVYWLL